MSELQALVQKAIARNFIDSDTEQRIAQLVEESPTEDNYLELDLLMRAMLEGKVTSVGQICFNVWLTMVLNECFKRLNKLSDIERVATCTMSLLAPQYALKRKNTTAIIEEYRWARPMIRGAVQSAILKMADEDALS